MKSPSSSATWPVACGLVLAMVILCCLWAQEEVESPAMALPATQAH